MLVKIRIIKDRLKLLKEHITDKLKESRGNRIKRIAESISNNIDHGKKNMRGKAEIEKKGLNSTLYINSEGRKIESSEEIWKECQKYYEGLPQTRPPENLQEEKI